MHMLWCLVWSQNYDAKGTVREYILSPLFLPPPNIPDLVYNNYYVLRWNIIIVLVTPTILMSTNLK